jgi:hypothetical protein
MLTNEQIEKAVADAIPNVLVGLRREIEETALYQAKQTALTCINKAVQDWCTENLIPGVKEALVESKDGLIALGPLLAEKTTEALVASITADLSEKLSKSWERKKIMEALFS